MSKHNYQIGNLVMRVDNTVVCKIAKTEIRRVSVTNLEREDSYSIMREYLSPIHLTPEWIHKIDDSEWVIAQKAESYIYFQNPLLKERGIGLVLNAVDETWQLVVDLTRDIDSLISLVAVVKEVRYVHEVQNFLKFLSNE